MYLDYINYFRGFAILLVVLGHFLYFPESTVTEKLIKAIIKGGTSPFVFISGFLFHHIFYRRGFDYKKFMKNKLKNVLLPYTIVVIPGLIYAVHQHQLDLFIYEKNKILYTLLYYLSGNALTATWYIPFAMLLFIASPIFIKFIELEDRRQRIIIFLLLIIKESQLQREKRKKSFVRKERRKMKSVVNVRLAGHLLQRRVRLKTVHIFLPVQMDLYIWQFRLL